MKVFIATATEAYGNYDISAVGGTREEALRQLSKVLWAEERRGNLTGFWSRSLHAGDWREDINVAELEFGKAYLDMGAAGQVYPDHPDGTHCSGSRCAFKNTGGHP